MCWITKHEPPVRHTAEEDIPVFKVMRIDSDGNLSSLYRNHRYYLKDTETTELQEPEKQTCVAASYYTINQGLHSYDPETVHISKPTNHEFKELRTVFINRFDNGECDCLDYTYLPNKVRVECVIPKGSEYYLNEKGEYVSNAIRIIDYKTINDTPCQS